MNDLEHCETCGRAVPCRHCQPTDNGSESTVPTGYWRVLGHADEVYRLCEEASGIIDAWIQNPTKPECTCRMEDDGTCVRLPECAAVRWSRSRRRAHDWLRRFGWTEEDIASDREHIDG